MQVSNRSIKKVCDVILTYMKEMTLSNSAANLNFIEQDLNRFDVYAEQVASDLDAIHSVTHLDNPHSNKYSFDVQVPDYSQKVKNPHLQSLIDHYTTIINELCNCQSKSFGSGILKFDYDRALANLDALKLEITNLRSFGPVDAPEWHTQNK